MRACFITAAGTDIGKTYIVAGLLRATPGMRALKPVMAGYAEENAATSDAGLLLEAMSLPVTPQNIAAIAPWRFTAALSPDIAAARENRAIPYDELLAFCRDRLDTPAPLLIEGVGGVMVPLDDTHTVRDWIAALGIPALLVTGSYLGSISHTLASAAAVSTPLAGIILNESRVSVASLPEIAASLTRFLPETPISIVPRNAGPEVFERLSKQFFF